MRVEQRTMDLRLPASGTMRTAASEMLAKASAFYAQSRDNASDEAASLQVIEGMLREDLQAAHNKRQVDLMLGLGLGPASSGSSSAASAEGSTSPVCLDDRALHQGSSTSADGSASSSSSSSSAAAAAAAASAAASARSTRLPDDAAPHQGLSKSADSSASPSSSSSSDTAASAAAGSTTLPDDAAPPQGPSKSADSSASPSPSSNSAVVAAVAAGVAETATLSALPETLPTGEATAAGEHSADVPTPALVNYDLIKRAVVSLTGLGAVDGSLLRDLAYVLGGEEETDELVEEFLSNSRAALQSITSADGGLQEMVKAAHGELMQCIFKYLHGEASTHAFDKIIMTCW